MYFLVNASHPKPLGTKTSNFALSYDRLDNVLLAKESLNKTLAEATLHVHTVCMSHVVDGTGVCSCYIGPKVKVKCQMMYFLVSASPNKPFDTETSNFAGAQIT